MDDGGGKFDHGVCLVLSVYPQSLVATAIQGADGPVESRDRGSIAREGAMLILILPEVQVVENYPSRLFHCCRWMHCSAAWESVSVALTIVVM